MLNRESGRQKIKDEVMITLVVLFFVAIGCVIGWGARCVSTNDKYLRATAERFLATAAYYDAETLKLKASR